MLSAIILAGGESRRTNGYPKALLKDRISGKNFIEIIFEKIKTLGVADIVVVVGAHQQEITREAKLPSAKITTNENWREGQISSLIEGIKSIEPESEGFILNPVDCPFVNLSTYQQLINEWRKDKTKICIPTHNGKGGHPAIFPEWSFNILLKEKLEEGAKSLFKNYPDRLYRIPVDDPAVLDDIDTMEDYEKSTLRRK